MTGSAPSSQYPRRQLAERIIESCLSASPRFQVLTASRGAGKTSFLRMISAHLSDQRRPAVLLDMEQLCTIPIEFSRRFVDGVHRAATGGAMTPGPRCRHLLETLDQEIARRKPHPVTLMELSLGFPQALAEDSDRPLILLLDELGEITRLSRHSGLRDCATILSRHLTASEYIAIVATVSPASRSGALLETLDLEARPHLTTLPMPDLTSEELALLLTEWGCPDPGGAKDREQWMRATDGRPLYAEILAQRVGRGEGLESAIKAEMIPHTGLLFQECRFEYHMLVERSRGHGTVKTILELIARNEGINLSRVARHLRVALPTALDYLSWLLEVDLIRREGLGYVFSNPLLRLWLLLSSAEIDASEEIHRYLEEPRTPPAPPSPPRGRRRSPASAPGPPEAPPARTPSEQDLLIEID